MFSAVRDCFNAADELFAVKNRQSIVAVSAFFCRGIDLPGIVKIS